MKHSRRQILEAIRYWEHQLEEGNYSDYKNLFESIGASNNKDGAAKISKFVQDNQKKADELVQKRSKKSEDKDYVNIFTYIWDMICGAVSKGVAFIGNNAMAILNLVALIGCAFIFWPMFKKLVDSSTKSNGAVSKVRELMGKGVDSLDALVEMNDANTQQYEHSRQAKKIVKKMAKRGNDRLESSNSLTADQKQQLRSWAKVDEFSSKDNGDDGAWYNWLVTSIGGNHNSRRYGSGTTPDKLMRLNYALSKADGPNHDRSELDKLLKQAEELSQKKVQDTTYKLGTVDAGYGKVDLDAGLVD